MLVFARLLTTVHGWEVYGWVAWVPTASVHVQAADPCRFCRYGASLLALHGGRFTLSEAEIRCNGTIVVSDAYCNGFEVLRIEVPEVWARIGLDDVGVCVACLR